MAAYLSIILYLPNNVRVWVFCFAFNVASRENAGGLQFDRFRGTFLKSKACQPNARISKLSSLTFEQTMHQVGKVCFQTMPYHHGHHSWHPASVMPVSFQVEGGGLYFEQMKRTGIFWDSFRNPCSILPPDSKKFRIIEQMKRLPSSPEDDPLLVFEWKWTAVRVSWLTSWSNGSKIYHPRRWIFSPFAKWGAQNGEHVQMALQVLLFLRKNICSGHGMVLPRFAFVTKSTRVSRLLINMTILLVDSPFSALLLEQGLPTPLATVHELVGSEDSQGQIFNRATSSLDVVFLHSLRWAGEVK